MAKVLIKEQIEKYNEMGFISPIRVMSETDALEIKNQIEKAEKNFSDEIHAQSRNNLHLSFAFLDALAHHDIVVGAMEDLIGPDLALWASVMFIKEPSTNHYVSWHQDGTYMGMNSNNFATPWIALTPSTIETGCMSMIPGSHKQSIQAHEDTFEDNNILTRGQEIQDIKESQSVNLILKPGEMSIHHGAIIHGSRPNKSKQRRIGFALQSYMPPSINQIAGQNIWMHISGKKRKDCGGVDLARPKFDMDPQGVAQRKLADENLSNILYKGSKTTRKY
ncbi:MAG: phytanoyl-CoA dioxygenase family protein [Gammaproteobacteria bacterium]|nr:phytanoyl-CoA dioxygenase family protein [Gammaproteobacteria bacterium]